MVAGQGQEAIVGHLHAEAEIIRRIYQWVLNEGQWSELLKELTRAFDSTYSVVLARNPPSGSVRIVATDALPLARQQAYESYYNRLRPASFFCRDDLAVGDVLTDISYEDYDAYLGSELYNDFFRPLEADHLMFAKLRGDAIGYGSLVLRRSSKVGFYSRRSVERLKRLAGHLCNAENIRAKVRTAENRAAGLSALLDRLGVAAFVADRDGTIRYLTAEAEQLLRDGEIFVVRNSRLDSRQVGFGHELRVAIRACVESLDHPERDAWRMLRVDGPNDRKSSATVLVSALVWTDASGIGLPASLVIVNDPRVQRTEVPSKLAQLFGLTRAESKLAVALCEGRSLATYAADAGISVLTARTLLKRALEKTDSHSQGELVGLLLRNGAFMHPRDLKVHGFKRS